MDYVELIVYCIVFGDSNINCVNRIMLNGRAYVE